MPFVHLHGHSTFSFLEAIGKPGKIIAKAKELGMDAIAITDYNGMYGIIKFYQTAKEESIKPIIGVELGFVLDINSVIPANQIGNIVLLAKNKQGYESLMELTSFANKQGIAGKPKIDINILNTFGPGVICIMGGKESWIGKMLMQDEKPEKIAEIIQMIKNAVGEENVYLEITAQDEKLLPEVKKVNTQILDLSRTTSTPCVVHNNFHYPNKEDKEAREIALAIKDGKKIYDEDRRKPKGDFYIMTEEEIRAICEKNGYEKAQIDSWIETNSKVAEGIIPEIDLHQTLFPNYDSPEDIIEVYEQYKDQLVEE
ncbi:MAG: PHP domain-containing protein [Candidatus Absconditabacterales bacterium]|jgi:DNA polymerase-3 subunit alpha